MIEKAGNMAQKRIDLNDEEKIVLYSIGALDSRPLKSKVKIQKLLYLFSNVFSDFGDLLEYEPHLLGPYSEIVDNVLEDLLTLGFIQKEGNSYTLTIIGQTVFNSIKPKKELIDVMNDFKEFLHDLPDNEVLTFIYAFYPDYISESAKWDELKPNRIKVAVSLLKKEKISFSKASELAQMNPVGFERYLISNNIRWRRE